MKILFIIDTMLTGGAQKVLLSHATFLLKNGHSIRIVSLKKSNIHHIN